MLMFCSRALLGSVTVLLLFIAEAQTPTWAQKGGGGKPGPSVHHSTSPQPAYNPQSTQNAFELYDVTRPRTAAQTQAKNEEPPCFHWPLNPVLSSTVSVSGMKTADHAREDFVQACEAVRKKDLGEAHKRLENAVKVDPQFAAAWVLLGQTQREQKKDDKALESCTRARSADPNYLPAYLCLADLAAHQSQWQQVAELTDQAAEIGRASCRE